MKLFIRHQDKTPNQPVTPGHAMRLLSAALIVVMAGVVAASFASCHKHDDQLTGHLNAFVRLTPLFVNSDNELSAKLKNLRPGEKANLTKVLGTAAKRFCEKQNLAHKFNDFNFEFGTYRISQISAQKVGGGGLFNFTFEMKCFQTGNVVSTTKEFVFKEMNPQERNPQANQ